MSLQTTKIGKLNLKADKLVYYALADIPGIGYITSAKICELLDIDKSVKLNKLSDSDYKKLDEYLANDFYILNGKKYPLYKYVMHVKRANIKAKILLDTEEGKNHSKNYRVNGQKRK